MLGENSAVDLLQRTLNEEGETDKKLTALAEAIINVDASEAEENGESKRKAKRNHAAAVNRQVVTANIDRHHSPRDCGGDFVFSDMRSL